MFSEGGGDALQAPLQNLAINIVAVLVLSVLFFRDFQSRKKELEKIEREGKLSKLQVVSFVCSETCVRCFLMMPQVQKTAGKAIPLYDLRGSFRPVIICGSKNFCRRAVDAARPYFSALKERGVAGEPPTVLSWTMDS